jgi:DNA-binding response OmpR family regulator
LVPQRSVLIVDSLEETREVLRTALEERGLRIFAASRAETGLALARKHHPDVIVLDLDFDRAGNDSAEQEISSGFSAESQARATPLVMLGSARRGQTALPSGEFVSKPYHYAPLIRKIEALLDQAQPRARKAS